MAQDITLAPICDLERRNLSRKKLLDIEKQLSSCEGAKLGDSDLCPLKHHFADGVYAREIFIPKGTVVVGKIHKDDHHVFLMKGTLDLVTEDGATQVKAPCHFISKAGAKRAAYAVTDIVWITIHANNTNTKSLEKLEKEIIAKDFKEFDKYLSGKAKIGFLKKIINYLIS